MTGASPYVGLAPFGEQDANRFFGRDAERKRIISNLQASRFTLLYARSGVGKTSLLRAGVVARLAAAPGSQLVPFIFSSWSGDPNVELPRSLGAGGDGLEEALERRTGEVDGTLLVIFDQFEEFFQYHQGEPEGARFADELARCVQRNDLRAHFLVSIREDAYSRLGDEFKGRLPNVYSNYLHLDDLDERGARAAIEEPLKHVGNGSASIETALVDQVLRDVRRDEASNGQSRYETAHMQYVLRRLWDEEAKRGSAILRLATLEALGGSKAIFERHFDEAMTGLGAAEQDALAGAFRFLVTTSGTKRAESVADLADLTGAPKPTLERALEHLREARVLTPVTVGGQTRYELAHDMLAAPILEWRQRHVAAMQRAEAEQKRQAAERRAHEERRKARRFRALAIAAALFALGAAVLAVIVVRAEQTTHSRELAASAISELGVDPSESLRLATEAFDTRETSEADEALRRALEESRLQGVMAGHGDWVTQAAYSPDGRRVATASKDGAVRLWDPRTGRRLAVLRQHLQPVNTLAFDRSGDRLLSAGEDVTARVWDGRTGRPLLALRVGRVSFQPWPVAFSGDGTRIVAPAEEGGAAVWDIRSGKPVEVARVDRQQVWALAFSSDGRSVATGGRRPGARVWDTRTGKLLATLRLPAAVPPAAASVQLVEFSPDGRRLLGSNGTTAYLWKIGAEGQPLPLHRYRVLETAHFSPSGKSIVTAGDKEAHVWSTETGKEMGTLRGHHDMVNSAAFSPDGRLVVTASQDGSTRVWSPTGGALLDLRGHTDAVNHAEFAPDGRSVVTAGADRTARVWRVWTGTALYGHRRIVTSAAFERSGRRVLTASGDGAARFWDRAGRLVDTLGEQRQLGALTVADLSPDGTRFVTAGLASGLQFWRIDSRREPVPTFPPKQPRFPPSDAAFSPDGRYVATAGYASLARVWDARTGRKTSSFGGHAGEVLTAEFSPDGRHVVTASVDTTARIWSASKGDQLRRLSGHTGIVWSAGWSNDGRLVVTAGNDGTVRVWDVATATQVRVLRGFTGAVRSAAFSPDDRWIVAGGNDGSTRVWDVATGRPLAIMHRHTDAINAVAFGPDGITILSAGDDHTGKLYRCETCVPADRLKRLAAARQPYIRGAPDQ